MPINYEQLTSAAANDIQYSYGDRETMLYALGLGMSRDQLNPEELRYTFENDLKTIPTMAALFTSAFNRPKQSTALATMRSAASGSLRSSM